MARISNNLPAMQRKLVLLEFELQGLSELVLQAVKSKVSSHVSRYLATVCASQARVIIAYRYLIARFIRTIRIPTPAQYKLAHCDYTVIRRVAA